MSPEKEVEVYSLVLSLMGMGLLGVLLNNIVYITLKDTPGVYATANNILLGNLCLCNLLVSSLVLPFTAIYVGYGHASEEDEVDIVFCASFTFVSHTTLAIFPFTLFALSWHVFLSGRRAAVRVRTLNRCSIKDFYFLAWKK